MQRELPGCRVVVFSVFLAAALKPAPGCASDFLPYTTRTGSYSGWSTTVRGDMRTVGMAGAAVGLGDTFIASVANPAGLAMTLKTGDINYASDHIHDAYVQDFENAMTANSFGLAVAPYPWGFSLGYVSPVQEGQNYRTGPLPSDMTGLSVSTREIIFGVSRVFFRNRMSLGINVAFGQAEMQMSGSGVSEPSIAYHPYALGGTLGAMYQFNDRFLLGMTYSLPLHYAVDTTANPTPVVSGFYQPVDVPGIFGVGLGWIPNRHFRADLTSYIVGRTPSARLLSNDTSRVGEKLSLQPRLGAAYVMADYPEFKATIFGGVYYEWTRIEGGQDRFHFTGGFEAKPWIFTLGWGIDTSLDYRNYLVSLGVDVFRVMEKLELLPRSTGQPSRRLFPYPIYSSDEDLARPLVKNWKSEGPSIDPIQSGLAIPKKLEEKIKGVLGIGTPPESEMEAPVPQPAPKRSQKSKPGSKKSRTGRSKAPRPPKPPAPPPGVEDL